MPRAGQPERGLSCPEVRCGFPGDFRGRPPASSQEAPHAEGEEDAGCAAPRPSASSSPDKARVEGGGDDAGARALLERQLLAVRSHGPRDQGGVRLLGTRVGPDGIGPVGSGPASAGGVRLRRGHPLPQGPPVGPQSAHHLRRHNEAGRQKHAGSRPVHGGVPLPAVVAGKAAATSRGAVSSSTMS